MKEVIFAGCFAMAAFVLLSATSANDLALRFEGIEKPGGTVRLAMYKRESDFMVEEKAVLYSFKAEKKGSLEATIEDLPAGNYAFAVFLDENNNLKLDKNLLGIPIEPYGFSKTPRSKWKLPNWEEVKFEVGKSRETLVVTLKRWALL